MSASAVSPANSTVAVRPSIDSVNCALRIFGTRNACTPFDTASMPVSAEHPLENARSTSRITAA